jgi:hypothetical protein
MPVSWKLFNHVDFQYAIDAKKYVYDDVISALNAASETAQISGSEIPSMANQELGLNEELSQKWNNEDHDLVLVSNYILDKKMQVCHNLLKKIKNNFLNF